MPMQIGAGNPAPALARQSRSSVKPASKDGGANAAIGDAVTDLADERYRCNAIAETVQVANESLLCRLPLFFFSAWHLPQPGEDAIGCSSMKQDSAAALNHQQRPVDLPYSLFGNRLSADLRLPGSIRIAEFYERAFRTSRESRQTNRSPKFHQRLIEPTRAGAVSKLMGERREFFVALDVEDPGEDAPGVPIHRRERPVEGDA